METTSSTTATIDYSPYTSEKEALAAALALSQEPLDKTTVVAYEKIKRCQHPECRNKIPVIFRTEAKACERCKKLFCSIHNIPITRHGCTYDKDAERTKLAARLSPEGKTNHNAFNFTPHSPDMV